MREMSEKMRRRAVGETAGKGFIECQFNVRQVGQLAVKVGTGFTSEQAVEIIECDLRSNALQRFLRARFGLRFQFIHIQRHNKPRLPAMLDRADIDQLAIAVLRQHAMVRGEQLERVIETRRCGVLGLPGFGCHVAGRWLLAGLVRLAWQGPRHRGRGAEDALADVVDDPVFRAEDGERVGYGVALLGPAGEDGQPV